MLAPDPLPSPPLVWLALAAGLSVAGCSGEDGPLDAGGRPDAQPAADAAVEDAGTIDAAALDAAILDSGAADAATPDAGGGPRPLDCTGSTMRTLPTDTSTTGPWVVGVRTATIAGLKAEIWYPAAPRAEAGLPKVSYDVREHIPAAERVKIPDDAAPFQGCDCYRDLPIDDQYGPYPVILFVHGTASYRTQSVQQMTHWASRGFVVVAADHPGLWLLDLLNVACGGPLVQQNLPRDLRALLGGLDAPSEGISFLAGRIDMARLGMAGHSAGGGAIADQGARAAVLVPLAAGGSMPGAELRSTLVMAADTDQVIAYDNTLNAYEGAPAPKRFVGIAGTGHLAFSGLCSLKNDQGQDIVQIGIERGVCGVALASRLFDCNPTYISDEISWRVIDDATAAAFEEVLQCLPERADRFDTLDARYPDDLAEVRQSQQ